jgi:hypothetical protein
MLQNLTFSIVTQRMTSRPDSTPNVVSSPSPEPAGQLSDSTTGEIMATPPSTTNDLTMFNLLIQFLMNVIALYRGVFPSLKRGKAISSILQMTLISHRSQVSGIHRCYHGRMVKRMEVP